MRLTVSGSEVLGVTFDLSDQGLQVLVPNALEIGTQVGIAIEAPDDPSTTLSTSGRVVHSSPNPADPGGLWRHRAGIALELPLGEFFSVVDRLAGRRVALPPSVPPSRR